LLKQNFTGSCYGCFKAYEAYFEASAVSNFTPQETIKYDKDMMTERDRINSINYARR
jgi:hypothetical protein